MSTHFRDLFVASILFLCGCGSTSYSWYKPGASLQQANQDGFECKQISRQPYYLAGGGGVILGGSEPNFEIWKECLEARGYTVREASQSSQEAIAEERVRKWREADKNP